MSIKKRALITGVTGQDGAYLAEWLISKDYEVHGLRRRASTSNTERINSLIESDSESSSELVLHYGDITDSVSVMRTLEKVQPDEIYNLAAQSHVHVSFDSPEYTANADGLGALRILEAIRVLGLQEKSRFYQASTSELFGKVTEKSQNESTPFYPRSPYGVAKLYAHWITTNYREAYALFACSGILFNHESPLRGEGFVTRKVTSAIARMTMGQQTILRVGNLDAKRDWGHAKDYVRAQWLMLQQDAPEDFVIATGVAHSVRNFIERSFAVIGVFIDWTGVGVQEYGVVREIDVSQFEEVTGIPEVAFVSGQKLVEIDPYYFRPTEVDYLLGDASLAHEKLGWRPEYSFEQLIEEMVKSDLQKIKEKLLAHTSNANL